MKRYIVSGIGTDVGKTFVSAVLTVGLEADYWKPIQTGEQTDFDWLRQSAGVPAERIHPPAYHFPSPESPHSAAAKAGAEIDTFGILIPETNRPLIIEGAGGLMVPLNSRHLAIDLFKWLNYPIILVVDPYLGAINHTLLSVEALKSRNMPILGLVINGYDKYQIERDLCQFTGLHVLGKIPRMNSREQLDFKFIYQRYMHRRFFE